MISEITKRHYIFAFHESTPLNAGLMRYYTSKLQKYVEISYRNVRMRRKVFQSLTIKVLDFFVGDIIAINSVIVNAVTFF